MLFLRWGLPKHACLRERLELHFTIAGAPNFFLTVSPCQSVVILVFRPHQERRYQSTSIWFLFPLFLSSHAIKARISWANLWKTILFWFTTLSRMSLFLINKYLQNKKTIYFFLKYFFFQKFLEFVLDLGNVKHLYRSRPGNVFALAGKHFNSNLRTSTRTPGRTFHLHLETNPPSSILHRARELSRWLHFVYISLELDHDLQQGCCCALTPSLSYLLLISKTSQNSESKCAATAQESCRYAHTGLKSRRKEVVRDQGSLVIMNFSPACVFICYWLHFTFESDWNCWTHHSLQGILAPLRGINAYFLPKKTEHSSGILAYSWVHNKVV